MIGLTALDITCPTCFTPRNEYCLPARMGKTRFHQERINATTAITRAINEAQRREHAAEG